MRMSNSQFYAPQTKIWEGGTKDVMRIFERLLQWSLAQIEYSRPSKVLRKSALHLLFLLPKSYFGSHKFESQDDDAPHANLLVERFGCSLRTTSNKITGRIKRISTTPGRLADHKMMKSRQ